MNYRIHPLVKKLLPKELNGGTNRILIGYFGEAEDKTVRLYTDLTLSSYFIFLKSTIISSNSMGNGDFSPDLVILATDAEIKFVQEKSISNTNSGMDLLTGGITKDHLSKSGPIFGNNIFGGGTASSSPCEIVAMNTQTGSSGPCAIVAMTTQTGSSGPCEIVAMTTQTGSSGPCAIVAMNTQTGSSGPCAGND
ncbi:hypothetical protein [Acinetobacter proteolyticus]|uniref:hypothetical protein n=1 Tax=Acinetobacter proteolyticus TaxID=1776741 RepID=UPI003D96F8E1